MIRKILSFTLLGILLLFGADFGRIIGKVNDSETGNPLVGADVMIEGTELGAATDEKGEYVILYVPVGTYRVTASYLGYDPYTYTNVVVNADQTTPLSFRLKPTVIEVHGVVAIAERPPITISSTQTGRAVTSQEIANLPVTTINQVITLQAGVVQSDLGTHIRGGRNEEITYFVDGIVTKVPHTGGQSAQINPNAIEEVTVVSGGFDAEYGEALSGVVNIVTKEGSAKPSGSFGYLTDDIFPQDKLNFGYNLYAFSFGGPLPVSSRCRYFFSGELMLTDAYREALYKVPSPRIDYRAQARLAYSFPNAKGKITVSGFNSREQFVTWPGGTEEVGVNLKYFNNKPMNRMKNWIGSATFNYMLTARTLTSLKVGTTHYDRCQGNRDYKWEEDSGRVWYEDYRFVAEHLLPYLLEEQADTALSPKHIIVDSLMNYHVEYTNREVQALRHNPFGVEGLFYTYGSHRVWRYWSNDDIQGRFDITHSIGKIHEFKTGADFMRYNMRFYYNSLPWVTNPFWDYYERQPYKFAAYLQDKMDFEGLIARLGVRFDFFDPKAFTYENPNNFLDTTTARAEYTYKVSPRLGFSLPVTDRMKLRFNYGHYFQLPALNDMYTTADTAVIRLALTRGNTIVGNIFMKPQKTVQYEISIENQFTSEIVFGFTAYFKDIYDLSQIRNVPALPMAYFQYFNVDYGNVKGLEFAFKKIMSNMWSLNINYTLQFAKGTASYAQQFYYDYYYGGQDPITGLSLQPPVIDYWLDFDERHTLNTDINFSFPSDFVFIPLQNFITSFVFAFHSGHPYTPKDLKGTKLGDDNSARMPGYWNVDCNASRLISIGPVNLQLKALIQNIFNTKQVIVVYETTGEADNHGDLEPSLGQFINLSILSPRYSPQSDYNHDGLMSIYENKAAYVAALHNLYSDPTKYNGPFRVQLGIGILF